MTCESPFPVDNILMKRPLRLTLLLLALLGMLFLALLLLGPRLIGEERAGRMLQGILHKHAGLDISFEAVSPRLLPWPSLHAEGLRLLTKEKDATPLFTARSLTLELALLPFLAGDLAVDACILERPVLTLEPTAGLDRSLPKLRPEAQASTAGFSLDPLRRADLVIREGQVRILENGDQATPPDVGVLLENISLEARLERADSELLLPHLRIAGDLGGEALPWLLPQPLALELREVSFSQEQGALLARLHMLRGLGLELHGGGGLVLPTSAASMVLRLELYGKEWDLLQVLERFDRPGNGAPLAVPAALLGWSKALRLDVALELEALRIPGARLEKPHLRLASDEHGLELRHRAGLAQGEMLGRLRLGLSDAGVELHLDFSLTGADTGQLLAEVLDPAPLPDAADMQLTARASGQDWNALLASLHGELRTTMHQDTNTPQSLETPRITRLEAGFLLRGLPVGEENNQKSQ